MTWPSPFDVPTPAETIAADEQGRTAHAVVVGGCLAEWDRYLSQGQPWPDIIEGTP
jgi:hypothetical protein